MDMQCEKKSQTKKRNYQRAVKFRYIFRVCERGKARNLYLKRSEIKQI